MMSEAVLPGDMPFRRDLPQSEDRRRFTGAALLSAVAHIVFLALLIGLWHPQPQESPDAPIPITLAAEEEGSSGATGNGSSTVAGSAASNADRGPANQADQREPQEAQTAPPEQSASPSAAPPAPPEATTAVEVPPSLTEALEPVPPRKPLPPRPHPPQAVAQTQPPPPPTTAAPQSQTALTATASQTATAQNKDSVAEQGVGGLGRGEEGAGRAAVGDGSRDGPGDDYLEQVRRWVTRFRIYPDEAITKKQEGVVSIGFKFARDGTILDAWIEQGSGFVLLDDAALKMIHAASPIPKVPDKYKGETLTLVMPERFRIGVFDRLFH